VNTTVPLAATAEYVPWSAIVTVPSEFLVQFGALAQDSVTVLDTKFVPGAAASDVPEVFVTTFRDWATPCGPEEVSAVAVGVPITVGV
jgi:hypothetical protein